MTHRAEPRPETIIGTHALCPCGRIVQEAGDARSRRDGSVVARGGWRHVSNPTSTMIPAKLREASA